MTEYAKYFEVIRLSFKVSDKKTSIHQYKNTSKYGKKLAA